MEHSYTIKSVLDTATLVDVISTAFTGNEWPCICNDTKEWDDMSKSMPKDKCLEDVFVALLEAGKKVIIEDNETGDKHELTLEKLLAGCQKYEQEKGCSIKKVLENGDFDLWEGDAIIQYALFGEVIYG